MRVTGVIDENHQGFHGLLNIQGLHGWAIIEVFSHALK